MPWDGGPSEGPAELGGHAVWDAANRQTVYEYAEQNGLRRATRILDPASKEVSFEYDAAMNLKKQVDNRLGARTVPPKGRGGNRRG